MERLQAAIEKARQARQGINGTAQARANGAATGARPHLLPSVPPDPWLALKEAKVDDARLEAHRVVTRNAGARATHFDILRTKILVQMRQNGWKRLAITSPQPGSGKTTTACNLALALGRQQDMQSILMDLDLRAPAVSDFFGVQPDCDTQKCLAGDVSFAEQALRIGSNVAVSMSRNPDPDPARTLLADETNAILTAIEQTYKPDIMIFDLPSLLVNDETRAFLKNVDCALIVVRAEKTRYTQFDACEREIAEQTNVLGTVLNAYRHARTNDADT